MIKWLLRDLLQSKNPPIQKNHLTTRIRGGNTVLFTIPNNSSLDKFPDNTLTEYPGWFNSDH